MEQFKLTGRVTVVSRRKIHALEGAPFHIHVNGITPQGAELAVRAAKRILHEPFIDAVTAALDRENEALNRGVATADFREAFTARMEKRPPVFRGR